jgi:hypothetical protein
VVQTSLLGALYVPEGASAAGTLSMPLTSDNSIALDLSKANLSYLTHEFLFEYIIFCFYEQGEFQ